MCDCLEKIERLLQDEYKDPDGKIPKNYHLFASPSYCTPNGICFEYHGKKKDGSPQQLVTRLEISPTFCPFCGKKYKEDEVPINEVGRE